MTHVQGHGIGHQGGATHYNVNGHSGTVHHNGHGGGGFSHHWSYWNLYF